ncbi:hypothetical protein MASR2M74_31970 [Paracoccaceae bacterium]
MRRAAVLLVALGVAGAGALLALRQPEARFRLPVAGKGEVSYDCRLTSTRDEAEGRAKTAHAAFLAGLTPLAEAAATQLQAAMDRANSTGDLSRLTDYKAEYLAAVTALRADIETRFGCRVNSALQAPGG